MSSEQAGSGPPDPEAATPAPLSSGGLPAQGPLEVSIEERGGTPVVHVRGEVDLSTCEELEAAIERAEESAPGRLVVDLSKVSFMDSTGVRTLLKVDSRARDNGRRLLLIGPPEPAARVFRVTVLDKRFEFIEELTDLD